MWPESVSRAVVGSVPSTWTSLWSKMSFQGVNCNIYVYQPQNHVIQRAVLFEVQINPASGLFWNCAPQPRDLQELFVNGPSLQSFPRIQMQILADHPDRCHQHLWQTHTLLYFRMIIGKSRETNICRWKTSIQIRNFNQFSTVIFTRTRERAILVFLL